MAVDGAVDVAAMLLVEFLQRPKIPGRQDTQERPSLAQEHRRHLAFEPLQEQHRTAIIIIIIRNLSITGHYD
jgi:hypothetical protein